jgi:hypothetical protein
VYSITLQICLKFSLALHDFSGRNFFFQIVDSNYNYKYFYLYSFHSLFKINRTETQHAKIWNRHVGRLRNEMDWNKRVGRLRDGRDWNRRVGRLRDGRVWNRRVGRLRDGRVWNRRGGSLRDGRDWDRRVGRLRDGRDLNRRRGRLRDGRDWNRRVDMLVDGRGMYIILMSRFLRYRERYEKIIRGWGGQNLKKEIQVSGRGSCQIAEINKRVSFQYLHHTLIW